MQPCIHVYSSNTGARQKAHLSFDLVIHFLQKLVTQPAHDNFRWNDVNEQLVQLPSDLKQPFRRLLWKYIIRDFLRQYRSCQPVHETSARNLPMYLFGHPRSSELIHENIFLGWNQSNKHSLSFWTLQTVVNWHLASAESSPWGHDQCFLFYPKHRFGHPENYVFLLPDIKFTLKYPKTSLSSFENKITGQDSWLFCWSVPFFNSLQLWSSRPVMTTLRGQQHELLLKIRLHCGHWERSLFMVH